jgi:outer membrane biosynthesis protein TonB
VKKASRPAFEQPAIDAVRKWVFRPARKDGHEVPAEVTLSVVFATE